MFRTRSQLPVGFSAARPICVNQYSLYPEDLSDNSLLRIAHLAAGRNTVWEGKTFQGTSATRIALPTSFEFALKPPESDTKRSAPNFKEWNAELDSDDDLFNTDDLEEFKSTDLNFLILGPPSVHIQKRLPTNLHLNDASWMWHHCAMLFLSRMFLPSMGPPSTKTSSVAAYSKSKPIPIAPHTLPLPPPPPYTRRSWVIPVRGTLPWRHATSAVVLLDSTDPPEPPDPKTHAEITWTARALRSFWSFLLLIREKNGIGPLGVSFHVSQCFSSNSQPTYTEISGMGAQPVSQDSRVAPSTVSSSRPATIPLNFLDHIKVYHDAANSMQLRNILDAWAFEPGEEARPRKIRLLMGARLVLLDERSKGVLVS